MKLLLCTKCSQHNQVKRDVKHDHPYVCNDCKQLTEKENNKFKTKQVTISLDAQKLFFLWMFLTGARLDYRKLLEHERDEYKLNSYQLQYDRIHKLLDCIDTLRKAVSESDDEKDVVLEDERNFIEWLIRRDAET